MADLNALQLLTDAENLIKPINGPPDDFSLTKTESYAGECKKVLGRTRETITKVTNYMQLVNDKMKSLVQKLHDMNKKLEESIAKALAAVLENQRQKKVIQSEEPLNTAPADRTEPWSDLRYNLTQSHPAEVITNRGKANKTNNEKPENQNNADLKRLLLLQNIAKENGLLQEFILKTEEVFEMPHVPQDVLDKINDSFESWRNQADLAFKSKEELELEKSKQETRRKEQIERERAKKGEEEHRLREEEKKRVEEESRKKEEEEEERKRQEEERKIIEDEKRKKDEEEMRRLEEERKQRLDPKNWRFFIYRAEADAVDGYRQNADQMGSGAVGGEKDTDSDVCCVVSAPDNSISKADLCCTIVDIDFSIQNPTEDDERIASYIISLRSERGEINTEAPLQVFLPHIYINEDVDEFIIKYSEGDGEWFTKHAIKPAKLVDDLDKRKSGSLIGMEINNFTHVKIVVVVRKQRTRLRAGEVGGTRVISSDDNDGIIQISIPNGAFNSDTELKAMVQPVYKESMKSVCDGRATITRIILVYCEDPPTKRLTLRLETQKNIPKTGDIRYTTIKTDGEWEFADFHVKENINSVELPADKRKYTVIEVNIPQDIPGDQALGVAGAIHTHVNSIAVKLVLKQSQDNPHSAVIQCIPSIKEESTLNELIKEGYSMGPDVSCDFYMKEGTKIDITCYGNVQFVNEQKVGLVFLTYMNSARRMVTFEARNEYYEREYRFYSGDVVYKFHEGRSDNYSTDTINTFRHPVVLPKNEMMRQRIYGNLEPEMIGLARFLSVQLIKYCPNWQAVLTNLSGGSKKSTIKKVPTNEDGTDLGLDREICRRKVIAWMNSRASSFNKLSHIRNVLTSSGYKQLAGPCTTFVRNFKDFLNDKEIEKITALVHMDAVEVSERLGLTEDEIDDIFTEFHDENRGKAAALIYGWRFTESAVFDGVTALDKLKMCLGI